MNIDKIITFFGAHEWCNEQFPISINILGTFMQRIVEISDLTYQGLGESSSGVESYKVFYSRSKHPADKKHKWL